MPGPRVRNTQSLAPTRLVSWRRNHYQLTPSDSTNELDPWIECVLVVQFQLNGISLGELIVLANSIPTVNTTHFPPCVGLNDPNLDQQASRVSESG